MKDATRKPVQAALKAFGDTPEPQERKDSEVAIYRRVSTKPQIKRFGLEVQLKGCISRLREIKTHYFSLYTDKGVSGETLDRKGFSALCNSVRKGQTKVVIAYSISRFSRNMKEFWPIFERWKGKGIRVITVLERLDTAKSLEIQFQRLASYASKSDKIALKAAAKASRRKVAKGGRGAGRSLYGYLFVSDGRTILDPDNSKIVERIFREHSKKVRGKNPSARTIADGLTGDNIPPPSCNSEEQGRLKAWPHSTIDGILANPKYIGIWVSKDEHGNEIVSTDIAPPIINKMSWCDKMDPRWVKLAKKRGLVS